MTVKPLWVAAYTDELDCVAMLQFPDWLTEEFTLKPGSRLLTVNMYSGSASAPAVDLTKGPKELKRYGNFRPYVADFLTDDQERLRRRKAEISEEEWQRCADFGKQYLQREPIYIRDGSPLQSTNPGKPVTSATAGKSAPPAASPTQTKPVTAPTGSGKILDVDFNPGGKSTVNAVFSGNNLNQQWAQTFTVGSAGVLAEIDVFVKHFVPSRGSLRMELRRTDTEGMPTSNSDGVLYSANVEAATVPQGDDGFVAFDIASRNIRVSPGEKYAVVLRAGEGASTFKWLGLTGNHYAGGQAYDRQTSDDFWSAEEGCDLGIRTFIAGR